MKWHRSLLWPTASAAWTIGAGIAVLAAPGSALRPVMILPFLLVAPGLALVRLLRLGDLVMELTLALALGVVLSTVVSGTLAYAGHWVPMLGLAALMAITLGAHSVEVRMVRAEQRRELGAER